MARLTRLVRSVSGRNVVAAKIVDNPAEEKPAEPLEEVKETPPAEEAKEEVKEEAKEEPPAEEAKEPPPPPPEEQKDDDADAKKSVVEEPSLEPPLATPPLMPVRVVSYVNISKIHWCLLSHQLGGVRSLCFLCCGVHDLLLSLPLAWNSCCNTVTGRCGGDGWDHCAGPSTRYGRVLWLWSCRRVGPVLYYSGGGGTGIVNPSQRLVVFNVWREQSASKAAFADGH